MHVPNQKLIKHLGHQLFCKKQKWPTFIFSPIFLRKNQFKEKNTLCHSIFSLLILLLLLPIFSYFSSISCHVFERVRVIMRALICQAYRNLCLRHKGANWPLGCCKRALLKRARARSHSGQVLKETNNSFASPTTTILLNEKIVTLPYMMMTNDDKKQHKMIKKTSMLHLTLHTRIHILLYEYIQLWLWKYDQLLKDVQKRISPTHFLRDTNWKLFSKPFKQNRKLGVLCRNFCTTSASAFTSREEEEGEKESLFHFFVSGGR